MCVCACVCVCVRGHTCACTHLSMLYVIMCMMFKREFSLCSVDFFCDRDHFTILCFPDETTLVNKFESMGKPTLFPFCASVLTM